MLYRTLSPGPDLADMVREYWIIEDEDTEPQRRKIIPDGYPEIIFHYGAPYRIRLGEHWERQERALFAGQITGHFYLENTGASGMIGIKLAPEAAVRFGDLDMSSYTDRVVPLSDPFGGRFRALEGTIREGESPEDRADAVERELPGLIDRAEGRDPKITPRAVELIRDTHGKVRMEELSDTLSITPRHLERLFKRDIGLSPKFYSRIVRFNRIFQIMKRGSDSWVDLALDAGYYDQSHFIRDFKAFSGEEPGAYGFDEQTMANFFLIRKG